MRSHLLTQAIHFKHIDKECKPNSLFSKAKQYESHITNCPTITSDITQSIINSTPKKSYKLAIV